MNQKEVPEAGNDHQTGETGSEGTETRPLRKGEPSCYEILDFTRFHDEEFVRNAYWGILKREPDAEGFKAYLLNLRQGVMTKSEILCQIRYSPEGRAKSVKVKRLFLVLLASKAFKLPVIGFLCRWFVGLMRLPGIMRKIHIEEARNQQQFVGLKDRLYQLEGSLQGMVEDMTQCRRTFDELRATLKDLQDQMALRVEIDSFEGLLSSKADRMDIDSVRSHQKAETNRLLDLLDEKANRTELHSLAGIKADRLELELLGALKADSAQLEALEAAKVDRHELESLAAGKADRTELEAFVSAKADREELQSLLALKADAEHAEVIRTQLLRHAEDITRLRLALLDQERKLWLFLEEAKKRLPEPFSPTELALMVEEEDHLLDALYVAFEDDFRGTREEIKERLTYCLPYMEEARAGTDAFPILDLGCGRGEWLELLKENGLKSLGIDCNAVMVSVCREEGLEVVHADALEFLKGQRSSSFGAITGFHIIEHLPFSVLMKVLDETRRVLKPGGVMIFETPNPKNVLVGATTFCIDPTHKNPIHPSSMGFIAEYKGFSGVKIIYLNPPPAQCLIQADDSLIVSRFNEYFYGPQDYAVMGYKPQQVS